MKYHLTALLAMLLTLPAAWGCATNDGAAGSAAAPATEATSTLDQQAQGLQFMREEEKLARDVYLDFGEKYGLRIFDNISRSEQRHMDAIGTLLARYAIADPAAGRARGEFEDQQLQQLYDELSHRGAASLVDALQVGALIEEIDIIDLQLRIEQNPSAEVIAVYDNLLRGSRNHLRAYVRQLDRRGIDYEPQRLEQAAFTTILSAAHEPGGPGGRGWRGGR